MCIILNEGEDNKLFVLLPSTLFPCFRRIQYWSFRSEPDSFSLYLSPALLYQPTGRVSFLFNQYSCNNHVLYMSTIHVCSPCHFKWKYINSPSTLILHTTMFAIISLFSRSTWLVNQALTQNIMTRKKSLNLESTKTIIRKSAGVHITSWNSYK